MGTVLNGSGPSPSQRGVPQLSCTSCKDRKLKCDRLVPCGNCVSYRIGCVPVYRRRLPRGRYAHTSRRNSSPSRGGGEQTQESKKASLATAGLGLGEQVLRLESFITGLDSTMMASGENDQPGKPSELPKWEKRKLRPCLQASESSGVESHISPLPCPTNAMEMGSSNSDIANQQFPGPALTDFDSCSPGKMPAAELCQIYLQNVDPIIKLLHRPTLSRWMLRGEKYLTYPDNHPSLEALSLAVCYAATMSMSEDQSQAIFHTSKINSVPACQTACEAAISKSDLPRSRDIITLQAFVLYLISRRAHDKTMAVRTLIAVAVRSARSLALHQDPLDESFFDQQARSRLWLIICLLDIQSSVAQISEPLISYREAASALARVQHINDSDFDPTTATPVTDREGLTDTTFTLINYQVELAGSRLRLPPSNLADGRKTSTGSGVAAYSNRLHGEQIQESQIRLFEQASLSLLHFCDPDSSAYAWFTCHSIQCLVAAVRLAGYQSMMAQQANRAEGSRNSELLRQALGYLQKMQTVQTDSRSEGFRWYLKVPWSALAIAIGECNVCADVTLIQRAWPLLQGWYQVYERSGDKVISAELVALMQQMQATASHHSGQQPSGGQSSASTVPLTNISGFGEVPNTLGEADIPLLDFENVFEADRTPSTHLLPPLVWGENILYYKSVRGD
ncbi:hypothetical protein BDV11DRAFT_216160 [Aspergillus similis]